jgi:DNA-binding NtrC family response regulator
LPYRLVGEVNDRSIRFALKAGRMVVGKGPEADLRISDPTISRRHAELVVAGAGVEITDLGSRNGSFIGGERVAHGLASAGDSIGFGHVRFVLEWIEEGDLETALPIAASALPEAIPQPPDPAESPTTVGTRVADVFSLEHFPSLLRLLEDGADETRMALAAGAALFSSLPASEVTIAAGAGEGRGVLFHARREGSGAAGAAAIDAGDENLSILVEFAHAGGARVFRPIVEAAATLLRLASRRLKPEEPAARRPPAAPAAPEPASVAAEVQRVYSEAAHVARGDVGVLISGESGTGKEVLARYLHAASTRAKGAFVALNCAALPRDLLEAELFGIERGVATGVDARAGKFELANGGTLFLDEIGDMALETQARILRVLQEGEVYRIGATAPRKAGVRIVAATNKDIQRLIRDGLFREDLYYRIATWMATLPPLRHRKPDIPNLAAYFLAREAARAGVRVKGISRAALEKLVSYSWPGNIRQLEKEMGRAVLFLVDGELLDTSRLSPFLHEASGRAGKTSLSTILEEFERDEIVRALKSAGGDVAAAAESLDLGRSTLYRRMKALGIDAPEA